MKNEHSDSIGAYDSAHGKLRENALCLLLREALFIVLVPA